MTAPDDTLEEDRLGRITDLRLIGRILAYVGSYRLLAAAAVLVVLLGTGLTLAGPFLIGKAVDLGIARKDLHILGVIALLLFLLEAAQFLVSFTQSLLMQVLGQRIMHDVRKDVFVHLQRLSLSFFDRNPVGRLVTRATNDPQALAEAFSSGVVVLVGDTVLVVGLACVLLVIDLRLGLVTLALLPLVIVTVAGFRRPLREAYRDVRQRLARINAFLSESLGGMRVIQIFRLEEAYARRFDGVSGDHRAAALRSIRYHALFNPSVSVYSAASVALIIGVGGHDCLEGRITVGVLVAFVLYTHHFFAPVMDLAEKYTILQSALAAAERIFRLLDTAPDIQDPPGPWPPAPSRGALVFEDVHFAYRPGQPVLHGISFRVEPGEAVAVVGATGAGKSTLINLLCRFHDVSAGAIRVDGEDVRRYRTRDLRSAVGVILQDVFIFSGTLRDNVRLGDTRIDDATIERALRLASAEALRQRLPGGLDARLQERGAILSAGERQLVAFARAIALDPRILVLDEATANIDTETERRIQAAIERTLTGRTSIIIAHRLSTVRRCDRILVLHRGELREEGTHEELLLCNGVYAALHRLQFDPSAPPPGRAPLGRSDARAGTETP